ncbi:futalosine hydrolase [Paenibacillus sp. 1_12]|uniref:futalosine hydrolase n=1 Tax=Paenibacillus sp. 1_12 TaxID=1566278 RepID=UPI0008EBB778|nr:futalosine hydrolase [Paenibacillus sp. 1_12]SFL42961.1 futalosine hydrolase [Paenibacillus sp. 1_12]
MNILVMTAVEVERAAVLRGLHDCSRFHVGIAGVGAASAAARTAALLAAAKYDLVISAGIAGGFIGAAEIGSLVLADEIIAADLGAESVDGFLSLDELGFGSSHIQVDREWQNRIAEALQGAGLTVRTGPILTVTTVTGSAATASALAKRIPGAAAEAMEGYGVAIAAQYGGIPFLELRSISNPVGPRDRSAWRIQDALQALESASSVLMEVLK